MGSIINYASQAITTTGTTVRLRELPLGTRVLPTYTITAAAAGTNVNVTTSASAAKGATTLTVSALAGAIPNRALIELANGVRVRLTAAAASSATSLAVEALSRDVASGTSGTYNAGSLNIGSMYLPVGATPVELDAGEVLTFGGSNRVTVTDYAPAGSPVLEVLPLTAAVTAAQTATTRALLAIAGCTDATVSAQPKTVDTTNFNSGVGKEMLVTGVGATAKVAYNLVVGDRGGSIITRLLYNPAFYNVEVFLEINRPFDGVYAGAAIVTNTSDQGAVQDLAKRTADMQFQGTSFSYVAA